MLLTLNHVVEILYQPINLILSFHETEILHHNEVNLPNYLLWRQGITKVTINNYLRDLAGYEKQDERTNVSFT